MNLFHVVGRIDGHHFTSNGVYNIWENASLNVKTKSVLSVMLWRQIWFKIGQILFVQSLWWPLGHHQLCPCQQWLTVNCDSLIVRVGVMHSAHLLMSRRYPDVTRIRRECPDMQTWYQRPGQHALRIARLSCIACCQYFNMKYCNNEYSDKQYQAYLPVSYMELLMGAVFPHQWVLWRSKERGIED